jgi:hypothetical protein
MVLQDVCEFDVKRGVEGRVRPQDCAEHDVGAGVAFAGGNLISRIECCNTRFDLALSKFQLFAPFL